MTSLEFILKDKRESKVAPIPAETAPYLSARPEEQAIEDILKEEGIQFTTPLREGESYHEKRPDYYYDIVGLGRRGLEIKNRNPASLQSETEADRDFIKDSTSPIDYWGSYQLTKPGVEKIMEKGPVGTILHEPIGFQHQSDPERWKRAFRDFIRKKKEIATSLASGQIKTNLLRTQSN